MPLPRGRRIIKPAVAAQLRSMLVGVLGPGGTASEASIPGYKLAGKTGTAQKPDPVHGGYSDTKFVASFVGFAPADDPRRACAKIKSYTPDNTGGDGMTGAGPGQGSPRRRVLVVDDESDIREVLADARASAIRVRKPISAGTNIGTVSRTVTWMRFGRSAGPL